MVIKDSAKKIHIFIHLIIHTFMTIFFIRKWFFKCMKFWVGENFVSELVSVAFLKSTCEWIDQYRGSSFWFDPLFSNHLMQSMLPLMSNKELFKEKETERERERERPVLLSWEIYKKNYIYNENAIKVCQKIQTAEKRGNVSFHKAQLIVCLMRKWKEKKRKKRGWWWWWWTSSGWRDLIAHFFSIKYLVVVFGIFPFLFFLINLFGNFCGWMPEFEDKAIKLLRNTKPTTITPTLLMLSKAENYIPPNCFPQIFTLHLYLLVMIVSFLFFW